MLASQGAGLAAVLNAAAAVAFHLDFELQREVLGLEVAVDDVVVAARIRGVDSPTMAPSSTRQNFGLPSQPFRLTPSKSDDVAFVVVEVQRARIV